MYGCVAGGRLRGDARNIPKVYPKSSMPGQYRVSQGADMQENNVKMAGVLIEAMPYIQAFQGKVIVVKYGGAAMESEELKASVMQDIVLLSSVGIKVVLVHGGGAEVTGMCERLGGHPEFRDGIRVTGAEDMEVATMVLAGKLNKGLVAQIVKAMGKGIGLSGVDGGMIRARQSDESLGFAGDVVAVNREPLDIALENGYIPVVATIGVDNNGGIYNVNADVAASAIATALSAEKLIVLTDVKGLLRDNGDEGSLIHELRLAEARKLMSDGTVSGGMTPKIDGCVRAVDGGVRSAAVIDGRVPHSILLELMSDSGIGTMIKK
jgi:acetylglutamate kinase